jgi:hypothetical protein
MEVKILMSTTCKFCSPTNSKMWREGGFYGFQCTECTNGNTAFVVLEDHRSEITEDEEKRFLQIISDKYPELSPKGELRRTRSGHWFEFLVRKKSGVI